MSGEMVGWVLVGLAVATIGWAYLGYPALILALARWRPRPLRPDPGWTPTVTACLPCRNEGARVVGKLDQLLALDYPRDRLELRVFDDASDDETPALLRPQAARGVTVLRAEVPQGKAAALNALVAGASGEVLLLLDCRQRIEPGALRALLAPLADPRAGAVSGELVLEEPDGRPAERGLGLYWRLEKALRQAEALVDSTVGVTGALYVVRRALFPTLPPGLLLDDLAVPLAVARQGKRIGFCPAARVHDRVADPAREHARKLRTLGGNVELPRRWPWVLLPGVNRLWFGYVSHKLARLAVPYAVVLLAVGLALLPAPWRWLGLGALAGSGVLGWLGGRRRWGGVSGRLAGLCHTFYSLNWAAFLGPWLFVTGRLAWNGGRTPQQAPR